jgi:hypothetical protein
MSKKVLIFLKNLLKRVDKIVKCWYTIQVAKENGKQMGA